MGTCHTPVAQLVPVQVQSPLLLPLAGWSKEVGLRFLLRHACRHGTALPLPLALPWPLVHLHAQPHPQQTQVQPDPQGVTPLL